LKSFYKDVFTLKQYQMNFMQITWSVFGVNSE
jgi:hypothetical protein